MNGSRVDPLRPDAEEFEAAILQVLAAMDGTDEIEQSEALSRFNRVFNKTINWTSEQNLIVRQYLFERGRIEAGYFEAVVDAMNEFMKTRSN